MASQEGSEEGQLPSSSPFDPPASGSQKERLWRLQDGSMTIGAIGKRSERDAFMTLDLVFKMDNDPVSKVVELLYSPEGLKKAWNHCCNTLDDVVYLNGCSYTITKTHWNDFIHQEISAYKEKMKIQASQGSLGSAGASNFRSKKTIHYTRPTVENFGEEDNPVYYLVACEVFLLTGDLLKLTPEEIEELPVIISWKGPTLSFNTDKEECFKLLTEIISNFNMMQPTDSEFKSFILAVIVDHMSGKVYRQIIEHRNNFSTQMSVSGPAYATGKSLAQTLCMYMFCGAIQTTTTSLTEATFYEMLDEGDIFVREFALKKGSSRHNTIDANFLKVAIPAIWERNERRVGSGKSAKVFQINGVLHVDANILREDLVGILDDHILGKLKLNFSGSVPISHEREAELIPAMKKNAKALFQFQPVLMQLALQTCVPACTPEEMERVDPVLRVPGDKREGQLLVNYDRVYMAVDDAIDEYGLERPALFQSDGIDRRSMTYFNTNNEDKERVENVARELLDVAQVNLDKNLVEHSERTSCFRVKTSDTSCFSSKMVQDLRRLKSSPSTFGGKKQRVAFLNESDLSEELIRDLHALCCRYDEWCRLTAEEESRQWDSLGDKFYARALEMGNFDNLLDLDSNVVDNVSDMVDDGSDMSDDSLEEALMEAVGSKKTRGRVRESGEDDASFPASKVYRCENRFCEEFNKQFANKSRKAKHDKTKYHRNAKGPESTD